MIGQENGENGQNRRFVLAGTSVEAPPLAPGLYLVSTPIGHLKDITLRALETLAGADVVLCEDTRHSARLLNHYGIQTPREALHEHNERARMSGLVHRLEQGAAIALVSDAGTPLVSDPGFLLARTAREHGFVPIAIPGASAVLTALVSSGLPSDKFLFWGFLPSKAGARRVALEKLAGHEETAIVYESPRRLGASLAQMAKILGDTRQAVVALELTKRFERSFAGPLAELARQFAEEPPKGEVVILVEGAKAQAPDPEMWQGGLAQRLKDMPLRTAVDEVVKQFGLPRKQVYEAALALKKQKP